MNVQCSPRDSRTKGGVCEVATGPCIVHPLSGAVGLSDSLDLDFRVEADWLLTTVVTARTLHHAATQRFGRSNDQASDLRARKKVPRTGQC